MESELHALMETFLAESEEELAQMEETLVALEQRPQDSDRLNELFRLAHTLKGNAAVLGLDRVSELAHILEDLLQRLRARELTVTPELVATLLRAVDALRAAVAKACRGEERKPTPVYRAPFDELARLAGGRSARHRLRAQSASLPELRDADASGSRLAAPLVTRSLRVGLAKLERLLDLTGEIGVYRGRLGELLMNEEVARHTLVELHRDADLLHAELQELVMKLRLVPLGPAFHRLIRTVHDLARAHGKLAQLTLSGEEVEVDALVVEQLRDPLLHMIRNAADHGIEPPETRAKQGKDRCGKLHLRARYAADSVLIELADDGAGLARERILARARTAGLVGADEELTEAQLQQLLFMPGFSTGAAVTELSGRGVGLDIVRRNIENLRGSVSLSSEAGKGTTVAIRLPLTLAIIDGLQVRVADQTLILPLNCVLETLSFAAAGSDQDGRGVVSLRGEALPYVRLRQLLGIDAPVASRESMIVVEHGDTRAGLLVDHLIGQSQMVIKPLAKPLQALPGISSSAILASGRVAFILDVSALLRGAMEGRCLAGATGAASPSRRAAASRSLGVMPSLPT